MKTTYPTMNEVIATVNRLQLWTLILYVLLGLTLYNTMVIKRDMALLLQSSLIIRMDSGTGPSSEGSTQLLDPLTSEGGINSTSVLRDKTYEDVCPWWWAGDWSVGFDDWRGCA